MYVSHAPLEITESEGGFFMEDFATTFDQFELPSSERAELVSIVESTKPEIVLAEHDERRTAS